MGSDLLVKEALISLLIWVLCHFVIDFHLFQGTLGVGQEIVRAKIGTIYILPSCIMGGDKYSTVNCCFIDMV